MGVVVIVDVLKVVIAEGSREASKSSLTSAGHKTSPSRVDGPLVCSRSPSWLALAIEPLVMLGVVNMVVVVVVAEVDVRTKDDNEPLEPKWSTKVG